MLVDDGAPALREFVFMAEVTGIITTVPRDPDLLGRPTQQHNTTEQQVAVNLAANVSNSDCPCLYLIQPHKICNNGSYRVDNVRSINCKLRLGRWKIGG